MSFRVHVIGSSAFAHTYVTRRVASAVCSALRCVGYAAIIERIESQNENAVGLTGTDGANYVQAMPQRLYADAG